MSASAPVNNFLAPRSDSSELEAGQTGDSSYVIDDYLRTPQPEKARWLDRLLSHTKLVVSVGVLLVALLAGAIFGYYQSVKHRTTELTNTGKAITASVTNPANNGNYVLTVNGELRVTGSGAVATKLTADNIVANQLTINGATVVDGDVSVRTISGGGAGLTDVNAATLNGYSFSQISDLINASSGIKGSGTAGRLAVFSGNALLQDALISQAGSVITVDGKLIAQNLQGSGAFITDLNASNVTTGSLAAANGGTGLNASGAGNGTLLIGNGGGFTLGNLAQGSGISITSGSGSITVAIDSTVCTTTNGLCTPAGGSIGSGTPGTLPRFITSTTIGDSIISQPSSTTVVIGGTLSVSSALQGNTLSIGSGAFAVNASGAITAASGLNSSGTITFSSLNASGVVHTSASGTLSTSAVLLGSDTSGSFVANLGALTGLTTSGNSGAGATPTLSVVYGSTANSAAPGNSGLTFSGSGNLTGTVSGTAGGGLTSNSLAVVSNPTFAGLVTASGGLSTTNATVSGSFTQTGSGAITLSSLGSGLLQTNASGVVSSASLDRNSSLLSGQTSAANGGTGLNASGAGNGTLLIGNGGGFTLGNLAQGSGISITSGSGSISIGVDNTVCTTSGNCATANAVTSAGGTVNTIALFTGTKAIGDSILTQSGSTISVGGTLVATALQGDGSAITGLNAANLASGTVASARISGNYSSITGVGVLTAGSIGSGFGTISTANSISTSAALQGNTLSIGSGAFAVNASGAITAASGLTASGAITFSALTAGLVQTDGNGTVSSSTLDRNSSLLSGQTSLLNGGTGSSTATGARGNLSAAKSGVNSDITSLDSAASLRNAAGALAVGDTTQALTLQGNASTVLSATGSGFTTAVGFAAPTSNVSYLFATAAAGSYNICTTAGNCATSGGVTSSGGTVNTIALFTGSQTIGNSILSQTGTTITVGGTLSASYLQGSGASITNLNGTNIASGTVGVSVGGTGGSSFTANGILFGNGSGALGVTAAGTSGQCLVAVSGSAPIWTNCSVAASGAQPGGPAGGDLGGNYPAPIVVGIYNTPLAISNLTSANILLYDGTNWVNAAVSGDLSLSPSGVATIANGAVSNAKLANSSLTVSAGSGLSGGGSVALGGSTSLSVNFGSIAGSAVEGNKTLVCSAGSGNLTGGGNTITLGVGGSCGSLDVVADPSFNSLSLATALTVANGGTGATTVSAARSNLGAAKSGANSDITSLTAVNSLSNSAALTIGNIGQALTLQGNASTSFTATDSGNTTTLNFQTPTANVTYRLPTATAGSYDLCSTAGNCAGSGTGVTTTGGTVNTIALFTGSQAIGDSILTQSSGAITVGGALTVTGAATLGSVLTNSIDRATSGTLSIAVANATTINIATNANAHNVNIGSATGASSLTLQSGTGNTTLMSNSILSRINTTFEVQNLAGTISYLTVDSGAATVSTSYGTLLHIQGSASFDYGLTLGSGGSLAYTTPLGATLGTRINIPNYAVLSYGSILAFGLPASSDSTARGLLVADARSSSHQATIGILSPNESDIFGLAWDGGNTNALLQTLGSGSHIGLSIAGSTVLDAFSSGVSVPGSLVVNNGITASQVNFSNSANSNKVALTTAAQANNLALAIPADTNASDTICLQTLANCSGSGSGVTTVGAFDGGTASANGASIAGTTLYLQSASVSNPGLVNTAVQTFAGAKTFAGALAAGSSLTVTGTSTFNGMSIVNASSGVSGAVATFNVTNTNTSATAATVPAQTINLTGTANSSGSNTNVGIRFSNVTAATNNNFYGLSFGTGYTDILRYNSTSLINGGGLLQNVAFDPTMNYSNLQTVTNLTASGSLAVTGNTTLTGNLAINGGSITSTASTVNLLNVNPTTINFGGNATTLSIGASSGTTTINNALTVTGIATANGGLTVATTNISSAGNITLGAPVATAGTVAQNSGSITLTSNYYFGGVSNAGSFTIANQPSCPSSCSNNAQTLNILNGGSNIFNLTANGKLGLGGATGPGATLVIKPINSNTPAVNVQYVSGQSIDVFTIQSVNSNVQASFGLIGNQLSLGNNTGSATSAGSLRLTDGTSDGFYSTLQSSTTTSNQTFTLPATGGTICVISSPTCNAGYIQNTTIAQAGANFNIGSNGVIGGSLAVNSGTLTSSAATINLFNTTPTTINFGGNATTLSVGAASGTTTINNGLTVTGAATFNGTLIAKVATFTGNFTVNGHIITGNTSGSTTVAAGAAANCGGTAIISITGNDTSGYVSLTTDASGGCAAGTLATVSFANAYGTAPIVVLTPRGPNGAALQYYAGSTTAAFTVSNGVAAAASTTYGYNYHVMQ